MTPVILKRPVAGFRDTWRGYAQLDRRIWSIAGVRTINTMGLSLAMAFMAIYLVNDRGISAKIYGLIFLGANLGQSWAQGFAGELSDRLGRRRVMSSALFIRSVVIVVLGVEVLNDAPVWLIACTLVCSSTLRGCFEPVAYALVADVAEEKDRVLAFGLQRMGTNLGWAVGPAAGGLLATTIHYGYVFFCAAGALVLAGLVTARITDPAHLRERDASKVDVSMREAFREALGRADFALFLACSFLITLVHIQLFTTMSIFATGELDLSNADVGLIFMINGIAVLAFQIPAVAFIGRIGTNRAVVMGSSLYVVAFLGVGIASGFSTLAMAIFILTLGEVILAPAHQTVGASLGDPKRMGRAFGLIGTAQMLGVAVAPLTGGLLFDSLRHRPVLMWGILAAIAGLMVVMYMAFVGANRRYRAEVRAPANSST